ncbi:hypothetical protein SLS58_003705 [Diplodia intermedia]|uniref:Pentatricopeptide repeat domain-containing protein n=1 Tax=Diplodia intermedia TaxID=856260 RepID=A0ABR3TW30_9PEZI
MAPRRTSHALYGDLPSFELPDFESAPESTREAEAAPEAVSEIAEAPPRGTRRQHHPPVDLPRTATPIDYKQHLPIALRAREPYTIYRCMVDGAHDTAFVSSVPPVTFTEILRLIGASSELEQTKNVLEHTWWMRGVGFPSINASMDKFLYAARLMMAIRKQANMAVRLADYKLLLGCAAAASDRSTALDLWQDLQQDGLEPDIECYNALMHAVLWDRRLRGSSWRNPLGWKVDKFYLSSRENGFLTYSPSPGGYETQVKGLFDELLSLDHVGDETTVIHLITANAREGNIMGVKDILRRVWNIHVDELTSAGAQRSPPRRFDASAPLHPTPRLLHAVGHAFGTNGDVPAALQLVDFISTTYKLAIPPAVWSELLAWTHVQSLQLSGRSKTNHGVANPLQPGAAERLWQTLTRPPYDVRPSMMMFHLSIKRLTQSHRHDAALERIRQGVALHRAHVDSARRAVRHARESLVAATERAAAAGPDWGRRARLRRQQPQYGFVATRDARVTAVRRDRAMITRWCHWYLKRGFGQDFPKEQQQPLLLDQEAPPPLEDDDQDQVVGRYGYDTRPDWAECVVPAFVAEFGEFCPRVVRYRTHTGGVLLELSELPARYERMWRERGRAKEEVEALWAWVREEKAVWRLLGLGPGKEAGRMAARLGRAAGADGGSDGLLERGAGVDVGSDGLLERETWVKRESEALSGKEDGQASGSTTATAEQVGDLWRASGFTPDFVGSKGQRIRERKNVDKEKQARGFPTATAEQVADLWRESGFTPDFVGSKGQRIRERKKRIRERKKAKMEGEAATV